MTVKPWGKIEWLLPRTKIDSWHVVTSSSFEDRCLALVTWLCATGTIVDSSTIFRITNPPSDLWAEALPFVEKNFASLRTLLHGDTHNFIDLGLLDQVGSIANSDALNPHGGQSVILDITTLPKRFFLFSLKQLLNSPTVKNLVVTYARAKDYPESALCEDALPPTALPGYGRIYESEEKSRLIVGVGYMPLSVEELIEQAKYSRLDFVFPFPPASPAFRRNWDLLTMLMPTDFPRSTEIHRVHGMDAFEVFERVKAWGDGHIIDLLPIGPKPHTLGMAMAYLRLNGYAEITYSQPQAYRYNYSRGIAMNSEGKPHILAYCLKLGGRQLF